MQKFISQPDTAPDRDILDLVERFLDAYKTIENQNDVPHILFKDEKSGGYYIICHLLGDILVRNADIEAVLDPDESEEYKLNRDIYTDSYAYRKMVSDALQSRIFEDIVTEFDSSYRATRPLKVFGGQHRIQAIRTAVGKSVVQVHGVRVYFGLSREQRFDIATANNTAIAVSNDLLDRMQEENLGTELREWCQKTGLLDAGENFADKRNSQGVPTVRTARTLIVNYFLGKYSKKGDLLQPNVTKSGPGVDTEYLGLREEIDWSDDNLERLGSEFTKLHRLQRERVLSRDENTFVEFANKSIHPTVTAAWAFATGYLENSYPEGLRKHFSLSEEPDDDPLNAIALLKARLKGSDSDTYRGIGSRINTQELGRTLEVFLLQALAAKRKGINLRLANAAIKSYEAKKMKASADKELERI